MKFLNPTSLLLELFALVLMFKAHLAVIDVVIEDILVGKHAGSLCSEIPCLNDDECAKCLTGKL